MSIDSKAIDATTQVVMPQTDDALAAVAVVRGLRVAGHGAYLVGGCVRDLLRGDVPKDYDVATSAHPDEVAACFERVVPVGAAFGVMLVITRPRRGADPVHVEVATFRAEGGYSDGRRPDAVRFTDAREDVLRRDFTLNGLLLDPLDADGGVARTGRVVDFVGGIADLRAGVLRAIGEPRRRFEEDALRLLRAVRFAARFDLQLEPATADAVRALAPTLERVSRERIREELDRMVCGANSARAVSLLIRLGLAPVLWPAVVALDVGQHRLLARHAAALAVLADAPVGHRQGRLVPLTAPDLPLALVLWLHDAWRGTALRPEALKRWRLSNDEKRAVDQTWRCLSALRRLGGPDGFALLNAVAEREPRVLRTLRDPGADRALVVAAAEHHVGHGDHGAWTALRQTRATADEAAWFPPQLVDGRTLRSWGAKPGPAFKRAILAAEDAQLRGGDEAAAEAAARAALG